MKLKRAQEPLLYQNHNRQNMTMEAPTRLDPCLSTVWELEIVNLVTALSPPIHYFPPFFPDSPHERTEKSSCRNFGRG